MTKSFILAIVTVLTLSQTPVRAESRAQLRYPAACILQIVATKMNATLRPEIVAPIVRFESQTTLQEFQDTVEPWWGFRPDAITNVFVPTSNQIFVIDDPSYYQKVNRAIDDSLAHEYAHFIQVRYRNYDLQAEEFAELEAIEIQTWFRENYVFQSSDVGETCGGATGGGIDLNVKK